MEAGVENIPGLEITDYNPALDWTTLDNEESDCDRAG